jgi:hypothetical protein
MRLAITVLTGLVAAGLAGCASSAFPTGTQVAPVTAPHQPSATAPHQPSATPSRERATKTSAEALVLPTPLGKATKTDARAAATQFDVVYASSNFTASWEMLASSTRKEIPRAVWVAVHDRCAATGAAGRIVVKSVTVFGTAAVVTATTGRSSGAAKEIFNYGKGGWHYMPDDPSIYHHLTIQADVSAARMAGVCMTGKYF